MAVNIVPAPAGAANPGVRPSPLELRRIRAALVDRIDAAMERRVCRQPMAGMPTILVAAGCYLAVHGFDDDACEGERWFGYDFAGYREFLIGYPQIVDDGRKAIYEGRRGIAPVAALEIAA